MNIFGRLARRIETLDDKLCRITKTQAEKEYDELKKQTIELLQKRAEAFIAENKYIKAGAAKKLAEELKGDANVQ